MRISLGETRLKFFQVPRLNRRKVWRDELQVMNLVTIRDHLRKVEQLQQFSRQRRGLLPRRGKIAVQTPGGDGDAAAFVGRAGGRGLALRDGPQGIATSERTA